jgi:predicted NBD/HSP70 family sugar kinase
MHPTRATPSSDQSRKRAANRYAILRALHFDGPLQRADLARQLGIRKSSVTSITAELIEQSLVVEEEPNSLRTPLSLRATDACAVVAHVDVGQITTARVRLDGTVESVRKIDFPPGAPAERILKSIEQGIAQELTRAGKRVIGLGVAGTGIVDPHSGVPLFAAHLHQWRDVPVRDRLERRFKLGTVVDNEIRCQLWSSAWFDRHLRDSSNLLYIGIRDGLGGALMMDGRLVVGRTFCAGEFGHVRAGNEGRLCSCGKTDCLETYIGIGSIEREIARVRPGLDLSGAEQIAARAAEDRVVLNVLDRLASRAADVLCPILAALDPDALVLGTPSPDLSATLGKVLHKHLLTGLAGLGAGEVQILLSSTDHTVTLRGIGGMVIDQCFRSGHSTLRPTTAPAPADKDAVA